MRIKLISVADAPPGFFASAADFYQGRLPRHWRVESIRLAPAQRKGQTRARLLAEEAERIKRRLGSDAVRVALDVKGRHFDSVELAKHLDGWLVDGRDIDFIVGGADGLSPELLSSSDLQFSLSALTFPHHLAMVVLLEQLYRASTILSGHPYHTGH